jgi:hypothetical protein
MNEIEIFKDIPGYEGLYQVSNFGNVKSLTKRIFNGVAYFNSKERILKPGLDGAGYKQVSLYIDKKPKTINIHKLVAITFLNHVPDKSKIVVDHIDENKLNNRLENLQIITVRENGSKDKLKNKGFPVGISWHKRDETFIVSISHNKKSIYLGSFKDKDEASQCYQDALNSIKNGEEIVVKRAKKSGLPKHIFWKKSRNVYFITIKGKYFGSFKKLEDAEKALEKVLKKD